MIDLDSATVALDKAEAGGLLTYPDLVGKIVTVEELKPGVVERVGPLGFIVCWEGQRDLDRRHFTRRFFPWTVKIQWEDVVDAPVERDIEGASGADLDRIADSYRMPRYVSQGEQDGALRARLLRAVAEARFEVEQDRLRLRFGERRR